MSDDHAVRDTVVFEQRKLDFAKDQTPILPPDARCGYHPVRLQVCNAVTQVQSANNFFQLSSREIPKTAVLAGKPGQWKGSNRRNRSLTQHLFLAEPIAV